MRDGRLEVARVDVQVMWARLRDAGQAARVCVVFSGMHYMKTVDYG